MKIEKQYHKILLPSGYENIVDYFRSGLKICEYAGRTAYNSRDVIDATSYENFLKRIFNSGHHSVLEHFSFSVWFQTDRSVTHELVRHRIASYTQQSQRYCNYTKEKNGGEIVYIEPVDFHEWPEDCQSTWIKDCESSELNYFSLIKSGLKPQQARAVLNNSTRTEIVVTANLRSWAHIFKLRCSQDAHPQIRSLMTNLKQEIERYTFELSY